MMAEKESTLKVKVDASQASTPVDNLSSTMDRMVKTSERMIASLNSATRAFTQISSAVNSLDAVIQRQVGSVNSLNAALFSQTAAINGLVAQVTALNVQLASGITLMNGMHGATTAAGGAFGGANNQSNTFFTGLRGNASAAIGLMTTFASVITYVFAEVFISQVVKAGVIYDRFISSMTVSTGDVNKSKEKFGELFEMSNRLGTSFETLSGQYAKISIGAKGTVLEGENLNKLFESVARATAVLGSTPTEINSMFLAISQMVNKSNISLEELKQQLGERLTGTMKFAAQSVGLSMEELLKAIKHGAIQAPEFLVLFTKTLNDEFAGGFERASKTTQFAINIMENEIYRLKVALYQAGIGDAVADVARMITTLLQDNRDAIKTIGEQVGDYMKNFATSMKENLNPEEISKYLNTIKIGIDAIVLSAQGLVWVVQRIADLGRVIGETAAAAANAKPSPNPSNLLAPGDDVDLTPAQLKRMADRANPGRRSVSGQITYGIPMPVPEFSGSVVSDEIDYVKLLADKMAQRDKKLAEKLLEADPVKNYNRIVEQRKQQTAIMNDASAAAKDRYAAMVRLMTLDEEFVKAQGKFDRANNRANPAQDFLDRLQGQLWKAEDPLKAFEKYRTTAEKFNKKYPGTSTKAEPIIQQLEDQAKSKRMGEQFDHSFQVDERLGKFTEDFIHTSRKDVERLENERKFMDLRSNEVEQLRQIAKLNEDAYQARRKVTLSASPKDTTDDQKRQADAIDRINEALEVQKAKITTLQQQTYEYSRSWEYGARTAVKKYVDEVSNNAKQMEQLLSSAFKGAEDAFVQFVSTGKIQFSSLINVMIAELARYLFRQTALSLLPGGKGDGAQQGFMGLLGMLGIGGGADPTGAYRSLGVSAADFALAPFANGGIMTANGPLNLKRYSNGGIASSPQLAMFGEGSMREAYVPLPDGRSIPVTMSGESGSGIYVSVSVHVDGSGNASVSTENDYRGLGELMAKMATETIVREKQPGGILYAGA